MATMHGFAVSSNRPLNRDSVSSIRENPYSNGVFRELIGSSNLAERVQMSVPYQEAYSLFSSDSVYGSRFLDQLKLIPYSASEGNSTIFDQLNLTNNADDINRVAYDYCIEQIQNLVNSYYEFINTLPSTQVNQLRSAGVNAAITGQGLDSSELSFQPADSSRLAQLSSTNPIDVISQISNLFTSATGGINSIATGMSSIFKNINDIQVSRARLDLDRSRFDLDSVSGLSSMVTSLANAGFDLTTSDFSSVDGVRAFLDQVNSDPKMLEIVNNTLSSAGKSVITSQPWRSAAYLSSGDHNPVLDGIYKSHRISPTQSFDEFFSSVASYEADIMVLDTLRKRAKAIFDADVAEKINNIDGSSDAGADAYVADLRSSTSQDIYDELVNSTKYEYLSSWIDRYNKTQDPAEQFMILKSIYDLGLIDMVDYDLLEKVGSPILTNIIKKAPEKILDKAGMFFPAGKAKKVVKSVFKSNSSK